MDTTRLSEMLADAESELKAAETRIVHLRQVVDGLRGLLGPRVGANVTLPPKPHGSAAVVIPEGAEPFAPGETAGDAFRNAIKERPNQAVTVADLWKSIGPRLQGGYTAPRNAVNAAARRIAADPKEQIRRLPDGKYIYTVAADDARTVQSQVNPSNSAQAKENGLMGLALTSALAATRAPGQTPYIDLPASAEG
jgi:hypothetical protein